VIATDPDLIRTTVVSVPYAPRRTSIRLRGIEATRTVAVLSLWLSAPTTARATEVWPLAAFRER
jgi:hypothetical protein